MKKMYKQDPMYLFTTYSILTLILKFKKAENRRSYINSSRRFPNGKYYTCVCSLEEILRAPSTVWGGLGHSTGRAVPCREGCTGGAQRLGNGHHMPSTRMWQTGCLLPTGSSDSSLNNLFAVSLAKLASISPCFLPFHLKCAVLFLQ